MRADHGRSRGAQTVRYSASQRSSPEPRGRRALRQLRSKNPQHCRHNTRKERHAFLSVQPSSRPPARHPRARLHPPDAHPGAGDPAGARGPGRARLRHDRQRQDRGVPAADPAPADRQAARRRRARWSSRRRASSRRRSTSTCDELALHTPLTGAAVFGGVGMGPQEHAFRSGVDVIVATPGRLLDHFRIGLRAARRARGPGARRGRPHARHGLPARHPAHPEAPAGRARRRCSSRATMPPPIVALSREMLHDPGDDQPRAQRGAGDRHHAGRLSGRAGAQVGAAASSSSSAATSRARSSSRAPSTAPNRLADFLEQPRRRARRASTATAARRSAPRRSPASRAASTACWWRPTSPRAASTSRRCRTSSTSTCPTSPDDYIHRVGRTARAEADGRRVHLRLAARRRATCARSSARSASRCRA